MMSSVNGMVIGLVTNVADPLQQNRIKVHFPWLDDAQETDWIRIATMMAGGGRGSMFMPEVNDEVLVAFEHGDTRFPYVMGFLWNGQDAPPGQDVRDRKIVSKNGHQIRFLDSTPSGGSLGALIIEDAHGNRITMSNGQIHIKSTCVLALDAPTITLNGRLVAPNANPI
jgi:uncharacterized protein involved in type VI secretion and phage assembly